MPIPNYKLLKADETKQNVTLDDCKKCNQKCCRYISVSLDQPQEAADFDQMRWLILHQDTGIYIDNDNWYLEIKTPCSMLEQDGNCKMYEDRPELCKEYGSDLSDSWCEGFGNPYLDYDHYFSDIKELDQYISDFLANDGFN